MCKSVLLDIKGLKTYFYGDNGVIPAVDGVSLSINNGETLGIVGESGSGKSVTARSIMRLIPFPAGEIVEGEIIFDGNNILDRSPTEMRQIRGNNISMIFQEPMTSLNPVFTVGDQISEAILLHKKMKKTEAKKRAIEMLHQVGIPSPEKRVDDYPHQMSGGMRQRVMIAMALSCNPKLLIADEPTTALDVTIQAQILRLMMNLKERLGTAIMLITHDLGVIAQIADRVAVMYAGRILEEADVTTLFQKPYHPYTIGLLGSIPLLNEDCTRLRVIPGAVPNPTEFPPGCRFHPRCDFVRDICRDKVPPLVNLDSSHSVSCWKALDYQSR
jgi:oligopeptide/dipeptide ABC transporter ATP-binding protein